PDLPIKPVSAFTYRHGNLTVFDLAYGPNGWFLKSPSTTTSNTTETKFLQTTTELPEVKWNSTWRYTRRSWSKTFTSTTKI
ncbi:unnamed protein product, partial [Rotaria magnacalcarata]